MEEQTQTITIPMGQFMDLLIANANIEALRNYVNSEKYPNRKVMCSIVGINYKGEE